MIIIDKVCGKETSLCVEELKLTYPDLISVNHFPNEHIIGFVSDYKNGSPKKSAFDKISFNMSQKLIDIAAKEFSKA